MKKYITIKIWLDTRRKLRLIAAETGETIIAVVDRLSSQELQRLDADERTLSDE